MGFLLLIILPIVLYTLTCLHSLYNNYQIAQKTGLKIVVAPFYYYGMAWQLLFPPVRPLLKNIAWARLMDTTWLWQDDDAMFQERGSAYIVVSPGGCVLYTNDAVAVDHVFARRKEFPKGDVYESMEFYGKNVDTVNGEEWSRHRRLTAPCFNERVSGFVWDESLRQARSMLSHWISSPNGKISNMVEDTRVVALHVLSAAGFGVSHDWEGGARNPTPGHTLSHRDALMAILDNLLATILFAKLPWIQKVAGLLSKKWQLVISGMNEFQQYMDEMVVSERQALAQGASKPNLISSLIRTSDAAKSDKSAFQLTDDEIKGNIFIFSLAGHDTTANTLAYAICLLALHPEVQDWVMEEIDEVVGDADILEYQNIFPRLKRVLAVMYETLRLYGQVPILPRDVAPGTHLILSDPASLSSPTTKTIPVPPGIVVALNLHATMVSPLNFPDPKSWTPKRWIASPPVPLPGSSSPPLSTVLAGEQFQYAEKGFVPWAGGPRICPGMKFAQVEFAGVLTTVLKKARVGPSVKGDRSVSFEEASKVVYGLMRHSDAYGATLKLTRPEDIYLSVEKR